MKALSLTFGASVLACGTGPCATLTQTSYTPPLSFGSSFIGQSSFGNSFSGPGRVIDTSYSPFAANKPWQQSSGHASVPSHWQNSPPSVWTPSQAQLPARVPATPRPSNPLLAGRPPSEQLQITKCRSGQSCEKCRQLNCFWDSSAKITSRCIALGLESSQIPIEAGQSSNLGYCPTIGQQGFTGVNWLAIENSGAAVPNLEGMSDVGVQQWLSSIPNYDPDATDANYPAGTAFTELLPTAAKAYAQGSIPSTTPWISFFDSLNGGYNYEYLDSSYTYDLPSDYSSYSNIGMSGSFGLSSGIPDWDSSPFGSPSFAGPAIGGLPAGISGSWSSSSFGPAPSLITGLNSGSFSAPFVPPPSFGVPAIGGLPSAISGSWSSSSFGPAPGLVTGLNSGSFSAPFVPPPPPSFGAPALGGLPSGIPGSCCHGV